LRITKLITKLITLYYRSVAVYLRDSCAMGNSQTVQLGIYPGKQIGSQELEHMWTKFAQGKSKLSKRQVKKFLKQLASEYQVSQATTSNKQYRQ
jgi:hypothetical protein